MLRTRSHGVVEVDGAKVVSAALRPEALEAERLARGVKKNNTLTECIGRRGLKAENAHRAEDDVRSLIELYKCQIREGAALVPVPYSQK